MFQNCPFFFALVRTIGITLLFLSLNFAEASEIPVGNVTELLTAINQASPGDRIVLSPGDYYFDSTGISVNRSGTASNPITVTAESPGCTRILFSTPGSYTEGFKVSAPYWTFQDLVIEGVCSTDSQCEHAFHVVGSADFFVLRHSILRNFNAHIKGNGEDSGSGMEWPDDVLIEANEFYNTSIRDTGNPVTPIDVVGGRRWTIRENFIHDAGKRQSDGVSYQAFLKGNSRSGLFERNIVACEYLHSAEGTQARVGLSFGGGGSSPDIICENSNCSIEHQYGMMRNNLIINCNDVGIYLNEASNCAIHHNTLYNNVGIDVRFSPSVVDLRNNLLTGRIRERDGGNATSGSNIETIGNAQFQTWFADPANYDFMLIGDGSSLIDQGEDVANVANDFCGNSRDARPDIGALEYGPGTCDTTSALPLLVEPENCSNNCDPVVADCGNGICETAGGEDCLTCAADCNGVQNGKPGNRYCCGSGGGYSPVGCEDSRCTAAGNSCSADSNAPSCCGNGVCESDEDDQNCPADCEGGNCAPVESSCVIAEECCSLKCKGPSGRKTCK